MKKKLVLWSIVFVLLVLQGQAVLGQNFSLDGFDDFRAIPRGFDLFMFDASGWPPERHTERIFTVGVGFDRNDSSRMLLMIIYNDGSEITYVFERGFISDEQAIYLVRQVSPYSSQHFMGSMRRNEDFGGVDRSGSVTIEIIGSNGRRVLFLSGHLSNTPLGL